MREYRYEIYTRSDGDYGFRYKAPNHEIIAQSEGYRNRSDAIHAINLLKQSAGAPIYEVDSQGRRKADRHGSAINYA